MDEVMCNKCGKRPAREGFMTCEVCSAKNRKWAASRKQRKLEQGVCPECGRPNDRPDRVYCSNCAKRKYRHKIADYTACKRLHICTRCHGKDARTLDGYVLCAECAEKARAYKESQKLSDPHNSP